jgi:quercetin dioxygenase-like cupin family protein
MKMLAFVMTAAVLVGGAAAHVALAQGHEHVIQAPEDAKWGPAPPFIPRGAQIAVLSGDPSKSVPYAVRLKFPANYAIPAHSHPTDENVVVTSGAVTFGMGNKLVKGAAANKTVGVGGYFLAPTGMNHFAYTTSESTIVLYGIGPVEFKYVDPNDDPRNTKTSSR